MAKTKPDCHIGTIEFLTQLSWRKIFFDHICKNDWLCIESCLRFLTRLCQYSYSIYMCQSNRWIFSTGKQSHVYRLEYYYKIYVFNLWNLFLLINYYGYKIQQISYRKAYFKNLIQTFFYQISLSTYFLSENLIQIYARWQYWLFLKKIYEWSSLVLI